MNEIINQLAVIKGALGELNVTSTRHNLDRILGSMQIIDHVTKQLREMEAEKEAANERNDQG